MGMGLITALVVCGFFLYLWKEIKPYLNRLIPAVPHEEEEKREKAKERTAIPTTLWLLAMSESDEWARESQLKNMHQMYHEADYDWNVVAHLLSAEGGRD